MIRFTITDLLLATTLVAFYAAGFSVLSQLESDRPFAGEAVGAIILVATMAATTLLMAQRGRRRLGEPLVRWKVHRWWIPHLMFLTISFGYIAVCVWRGRSSGAIFPLVFAAQQFLFLFNRWIVLGENGVMLGMGFVPWKECLARIDEDANHVTYSHTGKLLPPRVPLKNSRLRFPPEQADEIRAILAEKQGDAPQESTQDE